MVFTVKHGFAVPRNADAVGIAGGSVHRQQNVGVVEAVSVVHTGDQDGVKVRLSLPVGPKGLCGCGGLRVLLRGGPVLCPGRRGGGVPFLLGRPEKTVDAGVNHGHGQNGQNNNEGPVAPCTAGIGSWHEICSLKQRGAAYMAILPRRS